VIDVRESSPCDFECPPGATPEGEPPLMPDTLDMYNTGCNTDPPIFQEIFGDGNGVAEICGNAGIFRFGDVHYRDTDWFQVVIGTDGVLEATIEPGEIQDNPTGLLFMVPGEPDPCADRFTVGYVAALPCVSTTLTYAGTPGEVVWVTTAMVGISQFPDVAEYEYYLRITGIENGPVAVEPASWTAVKDLFR
jgi:hypothetical protein